jgi:hypothetical protein
MSTLSHVARCPILLLLLHAKNIAGNIRATATQRNVLYMRHHRVTVLGAFNDLHAVRSSVRVIHYHQRVSSIRIQSAQLYKATGASLAPPPHQCDGKSVPSQQTFHLELPVIPAWVLRYHSPNLSLLDCEECLNLFACTSRGNLFDHSLRAVLLMLSLSLKQSIALQMSFRPSRALQEELYGSREPCRYAPPSTCQPATENGFFPLEGVQIKWEG